MDSVEPQSLSADIGKPRKRNYFMLVLALILTLFATQITDGAQVSYDEWLSYGSISSPIGGHIMLPIPESAVKAVGNTLIGFFALLPAIIVLYFVRKHLHLGTKKAAIFKITVAGLVSGLLCGVGIMFAGGFGGVCSGEQCLGILVLVGATPMLWSVIALVSSIIVYLVNRRYDGVGRDWSFVQKPLVAKAPVILLSCAIIFAAVASASFFSALHSPGNLRQKAAFARFPDVSGLHPIAARDFSEMSRFGGWVRYYRLYSTCLFDCTDVATINGKTQDRYTGSEFAVEVNEFRNTAGIEAYARELYGMNLVDERIPEPGSIHNVDIDRYTDLLIETVHGCRISSDHSESDGGSGRSYYYWINDELHRFLFVSVTRNRYDTSTVTDTDLLGPLVEGFGC